MTVQLQLTCDRCTNTGPTAEYVPSLTGGTSGVFRRLRAQARTLGWSRPYDQRRGPVDLCPVCTEDNNR